MKKLNISSVKIAIKKIYEIRKEYIRVLMGDALLQAIRPFIPIILSALILDELLGDKSQGKLMVLSLMLVGFMLLTHIISGYFTKRYSEESNLMISHYFFSLSKKTMKMKYEYIEKKETLDLLHQIEGASSSFMAIWNIAEYMQKGMLAIIEIILSTVLIVTMFMNSNEVVRTSEIPLIQSPVSYVFLGLVLLIGLYFYSLLQTKVGETAANDMKGAVGGNRIFSYLFFRMSNNYENGKDIRVYKAQGLLHEKMKGFVKNNYYECDEFFVKPNIKHFTLINLVNVIMLVAVYTFIILKAYIGAITVGAIFIQINAIMRLYEGVGSFLNQYNMLRAACEHFKYSIEFFDLPEMKKEGTKKLQKTGDYVFEFKDVSFKYPGSESLVLDKINMTIKSGQRLAVVGMNGAGKTTMIKLLCRLYEPTEGVITLNGMNISDIDFDDYIDLFSVVFQDFQLFSFGMDKNIFSGREEDYDKLKENLKGAGLENILEELDNIHVAMGKNFDENGRDFSGGEKQKLAIARALYRGAPIVILDEPTAALDPVAEYDIYTRFNTLVKDKAAVFISHRLSSCRFCHNIAVFDKGKIVQTGDHESLLLNESGKYHELWHAQAQHYVYE
ncbi:ABC transporter ATP-binding protein [Acidaminobacter sp. JC074]|uniref:ABC transporter ATP-binding protein n=1 Tax=Acidaminobacter sp. JC074 TaxID=2530199 RepID=UPI001F0E85EB|nr:ABC transporter ATP-binding protein [Acidaminobacter sp. JC074]MCH4890081.1 ABC transporter ATP-binding protein [Acidaminobacter sp. JC074]